MSYLVGMIEVIKAILNRLKALDEQIARLEKSIAAKGPYDLTVSSIRGQTRFYEIDYRTNKKNYLSKEKKERIAELAQKEYEKKLVLSLKKKKNQLNRCQSILDTSTTDNGLTSLRNEIRDLVKPFTEIDEDYANSWSKARYYTTNKEDNPFITLNKDRVRSKSEVIIADRLYMADVPYHYEERLVLINRFGEPIKYYPDFTCLNKKTKQVFYWEHLGMLGDPKYCADNISKLENYLMNGIIQGKNLILTYECKDKQLSTVYVDQMIKQFLA